MYYEFNISLNGKHLFATAERSAQTMNKVYKLLKVFKEKFPAEEGYKIDVTYWEKTGKPMDLAVMEETMEKLKAEGAIS